MTADPLADFRARLAGGADATVLAEIDAAVRGRRAERGGHTDWGLLCEEAGLLALAFREFQLALRDDADDPVAGFRLAWHYREHGETARAAALLERLLAREPARDDWLGLLVAVLRDDGAEPRVRAALQRAVQAGLPPARAAALARVDAPAGAAPADDAPADDLAPADADCVRFASLFAGREDVHARQWVDAAGAGGYSPVREPLTAAVVRQHLLGSYTVGVYPIRLDGTCTFFAVDLDIDKQALEQARRDPACARDLRDLLRREARRLLDALREVGLPPLFENSGYKGRHYWVFLEQPESADVLHRLGKMLLGWLSPRLPRGLHLEFFPKQAGRAGKGLGNLIKLPLGIHRRTGHRSTLLDDAGVAVARPLELLRGVPRLAQPALYAAIDRLRILTAGGPPASANAPDRPPTAEERPAGPPPPSPAPAWTDADFQADPRFRHLLAHCPVLAELKQAVDAHRKLSHEEQLVLIHTLGHVEGGPQAVNYLFAKCVDVGPEKFLKDRLKGNPVSCPSIRKKIGHVTRRVACNCPFEYAPDRYPTPVLHLLTLRQPAPTPPPASAADAETLARRYAAAGARLAEVQREADELRTALVMVLRARPDRTVLCPGGRYRLHEQDGIEELRWEADAAPPPPAPGDAAAGGA